MLPILAPRFVNPADVAHLSALETGEKVYFLSLLRDDAALLKRMQRARNYHDGTQFVKLTDRLREYLGDDTTLDDADLLALNVCHTVVNAVTEKLLVRGFDTDEEVPVAVDAETGVEEEGEKPVATWATTVWQRNRMDVRQDDVHTPTIRDREAFVIVDWDAESQMPRFTAHKRYVSADVGGDAEGCKIVYQNNDPDQPAMFAVKRWTEPYFEAGVERSRLRMTVYYPDSIEKWASTAGDNWQAHTDDPSEPWPLPWVDNDGNPLGIAVIHFRNHGDDQEARRAIPLQNALNKLLVDLMQASDYTAFRILIALGWDPVDEDGNDLVIAPGRWIGTTDHDGKVEVVDGANLDNMLNVIDAIILRVAQVTDTPAHRFITTKAIASDETQKQGDSPLVNKLRKRQARIGNGWEDAMHLALRLHNKAATDDEAPADDTTPPLAELPEAIFSCQWEPAEARDTQAELEQAEIKQRIGVPFEQVMLDLGYEPSKVAQWAIKKEQRRQEEAAQQQAQMDMRFNGGGNNNGSDNSQGNPLAK